MQEIVIGSIPLLASFIISAIRYSKLKPSILRFFPWFLGFTFCIQIAGYYYSYLFKKSNHFIFNIFTLVAYTFYFQLIFHNLWRPRLKQATLAMGLIFICVYVYEIFLAGSFFVYNSIAVDTGDFLVLAGCLMYLSELLMAEQTINCFKVPMFWIFTGIMFANIGNFLYLSFFNYILKNDLDPEGAIYGVISTVTSVVEYSFFIIGFLIPANE